MVLALLIHYSHSGKVVPLYWQIFVDLGDGAGGGGVASVDTLTAASDINAEAADADVSQQQNDDDSESSVTVGERRSDNFGGGDSASRLDAGSVVSFGSQSTALSAATTGASTAAGHIGRSSANRIPRRCPLLSVAKRIDAEWQLARATQAVAAGPAGSGQLQQQQQAEADDVRRLVADSMPDFCRGVCPLFNSAAPRQLESGNAVWLAAATVCLTLVCSPEENLTLAGACLLSLAKRLHSLTRFLLQPMQLLYRAETVRLTVASALSAGGIALPFCTARAARARDRIADISAKACKF